MKIPLTTVSVLLKDASLVNLRSRKRKATAKRRTLLKMTLQIRAKKKSVNAAPEPSRFQMWPVLMPYDVCKAIHAAGLEQELWLASNIRACWVCSSECVLDVENLELGLDLRLSGPINWVAFWKQAACEDWGLCPASTNILLFLFSTRLCVFYNVGLSLNLGTTQYNNGTKPADRKRTP